MYSIWPHHNMRAMAAARIESRGERACTQPGAGGETQVQVQRLRLAGRVIGHTTAWRHARITMYLLEMEVGAARGERLHVARRERSHRRSPRACGGGLAQAARRTHRTCSLLRRVSCPYLLERRERRRVCVGYNSQNDKRRCFRLLDLVARIFGAAVRPSRVTVHRRRRDCTLSRP